MRTPIATVLSASADNVTVEVEPAAVCARCAAGKGCGAGLFGAGRRRRQLDVKADPGLLLEAGERVYLTLEPANIVKASLLAYGLPLLGVVLLPTLVWTLAGPISDLVAAAAAAVGLVAGMALSRLNLRRQACLRQFVPVIRQKVVKDSAASA